MSRRSIFQQPDSDASFASDANEVIEPASITLSSSSSISDECMEELDDDQRSAGDYFNEMTQKLVAKYVERANSKESDSTLHYEEAVFVDSSSDTGQATVGSSSSSSKRAMRLPGENNKSKPGVSEDSSAGPSSLASISSRRSTRLKSLSNDSETTNSTRRSTRLKSISDETVSTPSRKSSGPRNIDKVNVSSSSQSSNRKIESSQNSSDHQSGSSEQTSVVLSKHKEQVLQVRLQRMSVDMANLKMQPGKERTRNHSSQSETSTGPSPRKLRARTPSQKCLESFNLEDLHLSPRRRTSRKSVPSQRYSEHLEQKALKENRTPKKTPVKPTDDDEAVSEESENTNTLNEVMKKSTILYDQEADVAGQNLFSFRTPKKRDGMAQLAALAPKTPQTPKTPRHVHRNLVPVGTPKTPKGGSESSRIPTAKTPSRLRSIMKKGKMEKILNY